jgi:hypothetical protein
MNNYKTLMAVASGLKNSSILRLSKTWEIIDKKGWGDEFALLEPLLSSEKSFRNIRNCVQNCELPCIPHLFLRLIQGYISARSDIY